MTKICSKCDKEKSLDEFSDRKTKSGAPYKHARCVECSTDYKRAWEKERNADKRKYIYDYLSSNPCAHCGTTDVLVLEFDHINPKEKLLNICKAVNGKAGGKVSFETLVKEVAKCQVLCRNCHQSKTHKENNSWRYQLAQVSAAE